MDIIKILGQLGKLSPDTRTKVLQLLGLVAELSADPEIQALIASLTAKT